MWEDIDNKNAIYPKEDIYFCDYKVYQQGFNINTGEPTGFGVITPDGKLLDGMFKDQSQAVEAAFKHYKEVNKDV